mgnify:CR=1 FL=1
MGTSKKALVTMAVLMGFSMTSKGVSPPEKKTFPPHTCQQIDCGSDKKKKDCVPEGRSVHKEQGNAYCVYGRLTKLDTEDCKNFKKIAKVKYTCSNK